MGAKTVKASVPLSSFAIKGGISRFRSDVSMAVRNVESSGVSCIICSSVLSSGATAGAFVVGKTIGAAVGLSVGATTGFLVG